VCRRVWFLGKPSVSSIPNHPAELSLNSTGPTRAKQGTVRTAKTHLSRLLGDARAVRDGSRGRQCRCFTSTGICGLSVPPVPGSTLEKYVPHQGPAAHQVQPR